MDWTTQVEIYKQDTRIQGILIRYAGTAYEPDMSLSDEIRTLLAFTSRHAKDRIINGPEDLGTAEQILNEINQYRDRAIEIHLACIGTKSEIDRAWTIVQQIVLLQPEIQGRGTTESIKTAIVGQVAERLEDLQSGWDSLHRQSEVLFKNCRAVYDNINLQVEVAKQMWFQQQRVDNNAAPTPPTGSGQRTQQPTSHHTVSTWSPGGSSDGPLAGKLNSRG